MNLELQRVVLIILLVNISGIAIFDQNIQAQNNASDIEISNREQTKQIKNELDEVKNQIHEINNNLIEKNKNQNQDIKNIEKYIDNLSKQISDHIDSSNIVSIEQFNFAVIGLVITLVVAGIAAWKSEVAVREIKKIIHDTGKDIIESMLGSSVTPTSTKHTKALTISKEVIIPEKMKLNDEIIVEKNKTKSKQQYELKNKAETIYQKIGSEKTSTLLQQTKLLAIESKKEDFQKWISYELEGYIKEKTPKPITMKKLGIKVPDYRQIQTKFEVMVPEQGIKFLKYPLWIGQPISEIEDWIEMYRKKPDSTLSIKWIFQEDIPLIKDKEVELILPELELRGIIIAVNQRLSSYLEELIK